LSKNTIITVVFTLEKRQAVFFILGVRINRILRLWMRKKNIFRKSSTNVFYQGYKMRGKKPPMKA
jgi:hypothetical protein